jgi:hypothetical protein
MLMVFLFFLMNARFLSFELMNNSFRTYIPIFQLPKSAVPVDFNM